MLAAWCSGGSPEGGDSFGAPAAVSLADHHASFLHGQDLDAVRIVIADLISALCLRDAERVDGLAAGLRAIANSATPDGISLDESARACLRENFGARSNQQLFVLDIDLTIQGANRRCLGRDWLAPDRYEGQVPCPDPANERTRRLLDLVRAVLVEVIRDREQMAVGQRIGALFDALSANPADFSRGLALADSIARRAAVVADRRDTAGRVLTDWISVELRRLQSDRLTVLRLGLTRVEAGLGGAGACGSRPIDCLTAISDLLALEIAQRVRAAAKEYMRETIAGALAAADRFAAGKAKSAFGQGLFRNLRSDAASILRTFALDCAPTRTERAWLERLLVAETLAALLQDGDLTAADIKSALRTLSPREVRDMKEDSCPDGHFAALLAEAVDPPGPLPCGRPGDRGHHDELNATDVLRPHPANCEERQPRRDRRLI